MVPGFALNGPVEGTLGGPAPASDRLIDVMKCEDCGRSLTKEEIKHRLL